MNRYLLDTQVFVWMNADPARLSTPVQDVLLDTSNVLLLSKISIWELQIKIMLGKFSLIPSLTDVVEQSLRRNGIELLDLETAHIYALDNLPMHHKDPFDRLIIAQAIVENATLLSADAQVAAYASVIRVLW